MEIVALARLAGAIEDEARALAAELGTAPAEQRLKLSAGMPAILLATPDVARAAALAASLAARGHDVMRCRTEDVVMSDQMIDMRAFRIEPDAVSTQGGGPDHRMAWEDVAVLLRATHRIATETHKTIYFGAPRYRRTIDTTSVSREAEPVLYLFPRQGLPWLLREAHARYDHLGVPATPSSVRNFELAVAQIQQHARAAAYDDRLLARRGPPDETDVLAHLLAAALRAAAPFR